MTHEADSLPNQRPVDSGGASQPLTGLSRPGLSRSSQGGEEIVLRMKSGRSFTLHQEDWSVKSDYYSETLITHLEDVVAAVESERAPVRDILEIGIARGSTAVGLATLLPNTRIVGVDVEERARSLVRRNAERNGVADRISVRIGDMCAPVGDGETFDLVIAELPFIPIDADDQRRYVAEGHGSEILNISGGPDGRLYLDRLIEESAPLLRPGGSLISVQPSFVGIDQTLARMWSAGLSGRMPLTRRWRLADTVFTGANRAYIEQSTGYVFPEDEPGDPYFFITVMQGVKPA